MSATIEQYQVRRVDPAAKTSQATTHIRICDVRGEVLLTLTPGQLFPLVSRLTEVAVELASEQLTVEGMLSVPAVTAVDLAAAFEMGRQAGIRTVTV